MSPDQDQDLVTNAGDLRARLEAVQVVDVREQQEWDAGHIEGAVHIPLGDLAVRSGELDRDHPVVTVCRSGSRSAGAARQLTAEGFEASNLDGGLLVWDGAGLPVVGSDGAPGTVADSGASSGSAEQAFQADLMSLGADIDEHFGGREASPDEVEAYLRHRMLGEGMSEKEADEVLRRISGRD